jgi:hypothetical protein
MRSVPVLVAVAVLVAGLAVMVPGWLLDERDYLAVTPQPPAVEQPTQLDVPARGRTCLDLVALDEHSEEARIRPVARNRAVVPLELTLSGEGGYRARARAAADYRPGDVVAMRVQPPPRSLVATACVRNLGRRSIALAAVQDRRRARGTVTVNGAPVTVSWVIQFAESERVSILDRMPVSVQRMSVLRPAFVSEVTLWGLLALFVAGIPILALTAYARSLKAGHGDA